MEFFKRAKVFRLKCSHQNKYLTADQDQQRVKQARDKSSNRACWYYELVEGKANVIRLRSCWSHRYLAASDNPFLLGITGKKVVQTTIQGPTLDWEPIKEGPYIKLKSHTGSYLKANPKVPLFRNSITHVESGITTDNTVLWIVDVLEIDAKSTGVANDDSTEAEEQIKECCIPSPSSDVADYNESMHSHSFDKLKTISAGLDAEIVDASSEGTNSSAASGEQHIHLIEVTMAKQTLEELKDVDFHTIQSSEKGEKLEKALKVLIANSKLSSQDLLDLQEKLMVMKKEHESASQALVEYTGFSTTKLKVSDELKRDAAKVCELETFQAELYTTRTKREELLKQLNEIEHVIKDVEKAQADNLADIEHLISRMSQKSQKIEEMRSEKATWQVRKTEAYRMLERVEKEWKMVKTMFPDE